MLLKSVENWADDGGIWSLEMRAWGVRGGACLGNRCNYSARCVRSWGRGGGLSVLMLVSPYTA